jgi:DNA-directed RNA polymerase sigma subunit (sigma70/sigma32)
MGLRWERRPSGESATLERAYRWIARLKAAERNRAVVAARDAGESLATIAARPGVGRERVRQIEARERARRGG